MPDAIPASISSTKPSIGPQGQIAHPEAIEHHQRLAPQLYCVGERAWCLVGNGLSNQTFVRGPEGIIAIDTGESIEEMRAAVKQLRTQTDAPIVACIYTHFHYVNGTEALLDETGGARLKTYGHRDIAQNLERMEGEIAPRAVRGMVHQLGIALPSEGPDALLDCGLGLFYRNPEHKPYTQGYIPADHQIDQPSEFKIAGLDCELTPAPSDATDSLTIWFPELGLCVNNLVWPSLYNVYAIRGEAYRDPQVLLAGIDHITTLEPQHLICTHGPPLSGDAIGPAITDYRDALAFMWDQTIRLANQGKGLGDIAASVRLPERFSRSYFTQQFYGLAEHHVKQIYNGLFGWFDEQDHHLLPLPRQQRCKRLIAGFGGRARVRQQIREAMKESDFRWALELASWLVDTVRPNKNDALELAQILRTIAQRTTASNVRNWCLTRALTLENSLDMGRFYTHRFHKADLARRAPESLVTLLRVLVEPTKAANLNVEVAWHFGPKLQTGLRLRGGVAVPTNGDKADHRLTLSTETWIDVLSGTITFKEAEQQGLISVEGDLDQVVTYFECFDLPELAG